jgi:hypothetical protein
MPWSYWARIAEPLPLDGDADHFDFQRRTRWGETMILKHDVYIAEVGYDSSANGGLSKAQTPPASRNAKNLAHVYFLGPRRGADPSSAASEFL